MIPNCKKSNINIADFLDIFYPVGCYFETSNANFNPNTEWGGTWVQDTKGLTMIGAYESTDANPNSNNKVYLKQGKITGEANHVLTIAEMPSHNHSTDEPYYALKSGGGTQEFSGGGSRSLEIKITNTGGGSSHNNTQPSIGAYRWHRT